MWHYTGWPASLSSTPAQVRTPAAPRPAAAAASRSLRRAPEPHGGGPAPPQIVPSVGSPHALRRTRHPRSSSAVPAHACRLACAPLSPHRLSGSERPLHPQRLPMEMWSHERPQECMVFAACNSSWRGLECDAQSGTLNRSLHQQGASSLPGRLTLEPWRVSTWEGSPSTSLASVPWTAKSAMIRPFRGSEHQASNRSRDAPPCMHWLSAVATYTTCHICYLCMHHMHIVLALACGRRP